MSLTPLGNDGGGGNDQIQGGEGGDILYGHTGDDLIYADSSLDGALTLEAAIKVGETAATEAGETDLLDGGEGDDILIGSAAKARVKWRAAAGVSGSAITMSISELVVPRPSICGLSMHAQCRPPSSSASEVQEAQNNSHWELAA